MQRELLDDHPKPGGTAALCWLIVLSSSFTVVAVVLLHVLQPGMDPSAQAISEYVHGEYGYVMSAVFISQAIASLAMAALVALSSVDLRRGMFGAVLFTISAVGAVIAAIFPADLIASDQRSTEGLIHAIGGVARFGALSIALPLASKTVVPASDGFGASALRGLALAFLATFLVSIFFLANNGLFGLGQ